MTHPCHPQLHSLTPLFGLPTQAAGDGAIAVVSAPKDHVFFTKGETADLLYAVVSGQVGLFGADGERLVEVLEPGHCFGEEALFDGERRFTAKSLSAARIATLDPAKMPETGGGLEDLTRSALKKLTERQARLADEITTLKTMPPLQRLARLIAGLPQVRDGLARIKLPWRKKIIAERIGVRTETFSRLLPGLAEYGAKVDGDWVTILDLTLLTQFVAGDPADWRLRKPAGRGTR